jgi:hypothetical protein
MSGDLLQVILQTQRTQSEQLAGMAADLTLLVTMADFDEAMREIAGAVDALRELLETRFQEVMDQLDPNVDGNGDEPAP